MMIHSGIITYRLIVIIEHELKIGRPIMLVCALAIHFSFGSAADCYKSSFGRFSAASIKPVYQR